MRDGYIERGSNTWEGESEIKIPRQLKNLSEFVERDGFTLLIPFDNIHNLGYIGGLDKKGREHIVDVGSCFTTINPRKPGKILLGNFTQQTQFSLKSFLNVFKSVIGINVGLKGAKSITLKFPNGFLRSNFFTEIEIQQALPNLSEACRKAVADPSNFVITQTLETDAIEYLVDLERELDSTAQVNLKKAIEAKAGGLKFGTEVSWKSEKQYSIIVSDSEGFTVGYKTMRVAVVPIKR